MLLRGLVGAWRSAALFMGRGAPLLGIFLGIFVTPSSAPLESLSCDSLEEPAGQLLAAASASSAHEPTSAGRASQESPADPSRSEAKRHPKPLAGPVLLPEASARMHSKNCAAKSETHPHFSDAFVWQTQANRLRPRVGQDGCRKPFN